MINNCLFRDSVRKYIREKRVKNAKSRKNYIRKSHKKYRVYNVEDNKLLEKSSVDSTNFDIKKSIGEKLVALFKKNINKILKNNWIVDTSAFLYIIDQFQHFRDSLIIIPRRTIKIEERKLYSNQYKTTTIRARDKNKIYLINILLVSKLKINLLLDKYICQKDLYKDFDKNNIWIQNKQNRQVLTTNQQKNVYIVNKIASNLNKFVFIVAMQQESLVAFSTIDNISNQEQKIN